MPCNGCNDRPAQDRPAAVAARGPKVWLGSAYLADAAARCPGYHEAVLSRSVDVGTTSLPIHVVDRAWLEACRARFPVTRQPDQTPSMPSPKVVSLTNST